VHVDLRVAESMPCYMMLACPQRIDRILLRFNAQPEYVYRARVHYPIHLTSDTCTLHPTLGSPRPTIHCELTLKVLIPPSPLFCKREYKKTIATLSHEHPLDRDPDGRVPHPHKGTSQFPRHAQIEAHSVQGAHALHSRPTSSRLEIQTHIFGDFTGGAAGR
jgi:hypothetical protein